MSAALELFKKSSIEFDNGQSAELLRAKQSMAAPEILSALSVSEAQASILVCGSTTEFKPRIKNRLTDLLSRGVARAALSHEAIIIGDGQSVGVSEIVGQSVADRGRKTTLIGILPKMGIPDESAAVDVKSLNPNYTHFVVPEQGQQGWQTDTMCQLADAVTDNKKWILTLLVGGELQGYALDTALDSVRRKWPLVVIEGSGPLANEIVKFSNIAKRKGWVWKWINAIPGLDRLKRLQATNPRLFEIISDGNISIIRKESDASQLRKLIRGLFTDPHKKDVLWTAWQRFAEYDLNSSKHRDQWRRLKNIPLFLGAFSTLMVLVYSASDANLVVEGAQNSLWVTAYSTFMAWLASFKSIPGLDLFFRFTIILLPITSSLILSVETRLKLGSKYILLRGAAEAIKRGIYSFRTLRKLEVSVPDDKRLQYNEPDLAEHMSTVSKILLDSDVKESAFKPYEGSIPPNMYGAEAYDNGFSDLGPDKYVKIRIGDQLKFYTMRTNQHEKRIRRLQIWMLIWGGIGTFLAAIGAQYWLPLTATIVSATTAFLEYQQLEQILTKYNLTKTSLENVRSNWLALPDRNSPARVQNLVREVEAILESENQGWVQYVSQAQEQKEKMAGQTDETPPHTPRGEDDDS